MPRRSQTSKRLVGKCLRRMRGRREERDPARKALDLGPGWYPGEERGQEGGLERESLRPQGSLETTWPHSAESTRAQTACGEAGGSGGSDWLQHLTSLLLREAAPDLDVGVLEAISQRGSSKQPFKRDRVGCLHG